MLTKMCSKILFKKKHSPVLMAATREQNTNLTVSSLHIITIYIAG